MAVLAMLEEGNTIPFIARYRKEATGGLEEVTINEICDFTAVDANKSNDSSKNQDDDGEEEE